MDYDGGTGSKFAEMNTVMAVDGAGQKFGNISNQEYLLQGSIFDSSVEVLIHRLRGLCDNTDVGPESFHDHEVSFALMSSGASAAPPVSFRVRRAVDDPTSAWQLRYLGNPELGDKSRPTIVRSILDIPCASDIVEFLKELGCRREFDCVSKGFIFRKGRIKIVVAKFHRYDSSKNAADLEPVTGSHYVEMSVVAPSGQDTVGDDMKLMADQLKPLIVLDKVVGDYNRR